MIKKYVEIDEVRNCIHAVQKYRENISFAALDLDADGVMKKISQRVEQIPISDVVEVVRCKNCEHLTKKGICEKFRQRYPFYPEDDFHCGFGKRKEGTDDGTVL